MSDNDYIPPTPAGPLPEVTEYSYHAPLTKTEPITVTSDNGTVTRVESEFPFTVQIAGTQHFLSDFTPRFTLQYGDFGLYKRSAAGDSYVTTDSRLSAKPFTAWTRDDYKTGDITKGTTVVFEKT